MKIMFIDTETGGLNPQKHSLLSLGIVVWEDKKILFQTEFFVKKEKYVVTSDALKINNIELSDLSIKGMSCEKIKDEVINIISKFFPEEKVILAGQNVSFDIAFFKQIFSDELFFKYFSYRSIDTASLFQYLYLNGKLSKSIKSLDEAIAYFKVDIENRHTALSDSLVTAELFNKILEL